VQKLRDGDIIDDRTRHVRCSGKAPNHKGTIRIALAMRDQDPFEIVRVHSGPISCQFCRFDHKLVSAEFPPRQQVRMVFEGPQYDQGFSSASRVITTRRCIAVGKVLEPEAIDQQTDRTGSPVPSKQNHVLRSLSGNFSVAHLRYYLPGFRYERRRLSTGDGSIGVGVAIEGQAGLADVVLDAFQGTVGRCEVAIDHRDSQRNAWLPFQGGIEKEEIVGAASLLFVFGPVVERHVTENLLAQLGHGSNPIARGTHETATIAECTVSDTIGISELLPFHSFEFFLVCFLT